GVPARRARQGRREAIAADRGDRVDRHERDVQNTSGRTMMMGRRTTRREFLSRTALAGTAGTFLLGGAPAFAPSPRPSPNETVRLACIGVGGKGDSDTNDAGEHGEIVALCDIDGETLDKMGSKYPEAKRYFDYRKMLEDLGDKIDAVTVSTPDHSHAPASVMAMRMGKHCFCQKPLTWS